jgi:hypothetical protein
MMCGGCEDVDFDSTDGPVMDDRFPWTGVWPGISECREFGWYAKRVTGVTGWVSCGADEPGASEDLNRLSRDAVWDRYEKRFVLPASV